MEEADSTRVFPNSSNESKPQAIVMPSFPTNHIVEMFERWMAYDHQRNITMREMHHKLEESNSIFMENKVLSMQLEIYKQDFLEERKEREIAQAYIKQLEDKYNALKLELQVGRTQHE